MKKPIFSEIQRFEIRYDTMRGAFLEIKLEVLKAVKFIGKHKAFFGFYYITLVLLIWFLYWILIYAMPV